MALANVFLMGLQLFSDIGIGPSIIQNQRTDAKFINTAWTIQILRSFGIWLVSLLIAWPVAEFYQDDRLFWLVPLLGFSAILSGFNSTAIFTLNKNLEVKKLIFFETSIQIIGIFVTIIWAWFSPTIFALVAGTLTSAAARMLWSHYLDKATNNRLAWDMTAVKSLFTFGRWIFISTAMTFTANQLDRLMLGRLFSLEMLGVYTIAYTLADIPRQILLALSGKVIFPAASKFASLPRHEFREKLVRNNKIILFSLSVAISILVSFGDLLISFLYPNKYGQAAWMLPILALGIWPRVLINSTSPALIAIGKPSYAAFANSTKIIFMLIALPIASYFLGYLGVIIAIACNDISYYFVMTYGLWKEKLLDITADLKATIFLASLIILFLMIRAFLGIGLTIPGVLD